MILFWLTILVAVSFAAYTFELRMKAIGELTDPEMGRELETCERRRL